MQAEIVVGSHLPLSATLEGAQFLNGETFHGSHPDGFGDLGIHRPEFFKDEFDGEFFLGMGGTVGDEEFGDFVGRDDAGGSAAA